MYPARVDQDALPSDTLKSMHALVAFPFDQDGIEQEEDPQLIAPISKSATQVSAQFDS
jgi:hypothetical protein